MRFLGTFFALCPKQTPRPFPLACSPRAFPQQLHLLVSLFAWELPARALESWTERLRDAASFSLQNEGGELQQQHHHNHQYPTSHGHDRGPKVHYHHPHRTLSPDLLIQFRQRNVKGLQR